MTVSGLLASESLLGPQWESRCTIIVCKQGTPTCRQFPASFWAKADVKSDWTQNLIEVASKMRTTMCSYYGFRMEDKYFQMWLTRELSELAHLLGIEQKKVPVYVASLLYKAGHTKEKYDYSYYTSLRSEI